MRTAPRLLVTVIALTSFAFGATGCSDDGPPGFCAAGQDLSDAVASTNPRDAQAVAALHSRFTRVIADAPQELRAPLRTFESLVQTMSTATTSDAASARPDSERVTRAVAVLNDWRVSHCPH